MDEEEFMAWLETLSPEEQEQMLYESGLAEANEVPYSFGDSGMAPELSYGEFDLGTYNQLPPELNKEGEVMPWGLDQEAQAYNALQDVGSMTVDNALAMYGGPGAYDASAFQPTEVPVGQPLDMSDANYLEAMVNSGTGYEAYIANNILNEGMTPSAAVADMWAFINEGGEDEVGSESATARQELIDSLKSLPAQTSNDPTKLAPSMRAEIGDFSTPEGIAASTDTGAIMGLANDLFERRSKIPEVGYTDPETGLPFAASKQIQSETAKKFEKAGIPTPFESYMDPEWRADTLMDPAENDEWSARQDAAQDRYSQAIEQTNDITGMQDELTRAWRDTLDERVAAREGPQATGPEGNPYNLSHEQFWKAAPYRDAEMEKLLASGAGPKRENMPPYVDINPPRSRSVDDEYSEAFSKWRQENYDRIARDAQERVATEDMGTGEPWVIQSQGKTGDADVVGTYNFGGSAEEQDAQARLATLMTNFQNPGSKITYGQMGSDTLGGVNRGVDISRQARQAALDNQIRQNEIASSGAGDWAYNAGRALAMQRAGRTPMNDVLMQRAMARRTLMGR